MRYRIFAVVLSLILVLILPPVWILIIPHGVFSYPDIAVFNLILQTNFNESGAGNILMMLILLLIEWITIYFLSISIIRVFK